jgi:hypothetical protein
MLKIKERLKISHRVRMLMLRPGDSVTLTTQASVRFVKGLDGVMRCVSVVAPYILGEMVEIDLLACTAEVSNGVEYEHGRK